MIRQTCIKYLDSRLAGVSAGKLTGRGSRDPSNRRLETTGIVAQCHSR